MPATYVASSVRTVVHNADTALTVDIAAASAGQVRLLIINMLQQTANFSTLSGWTNLLNVAHPAGVPRGRLGIWVRSVTGTETAGSVTVPRSGAFDKATLTSMVIDGAYKRIQSTTSSDWTATHVCPTASLDTGDDLAVFLAAAAQYNRTWTWEVGTTEISETNSSGGPDVSTAYRAVSGSSVAATTATADNVEQHYTATLVFQAPAGVNTADFDGAADTPILYSVAVDRTQVILGIGESTTATVTVLGGVNGDIPIQGAVLAYEKIFPLGDATVTQAAATDANGQATITITGVSATSEAAGTSRSGTVSGLLGGLRTAAIVVEVVDTPSRNRRSRRAVVR